MSENTTTLNTQSSIKPMKLTKEEAMLKSYNETFYSTLKGLSFVKDPLPINEKLMYHFEQNSGASVSSTIGQLESALQELLLKNKEVKCKIKELNGEISKLKNDINSVEDEYKDIMPQINILANANKSFFQKQALENKKLKEEINILEKEKNEIQQGIYDSLGYLNKLEKVVGLKAKTYTYHYDQTMTESELSSKFIIKDEDI